MKLSEIKGERVFDVIADIIEPIAIIAENPSAKEFFEKRKPPEGMNAREFVMQRIKKTLPELLKSNKHELLAIFAAINGESAEEYAKHFDLLRMMRDCTDLLTDDAFISLFISAQNEKSFGSAQENTEAR